MSLKNLTSPRTFNGNSSPELRRAIGEASSNAGRVRSKFKDASPRDRIAISLRNVPGLRNHEDDFEVRAWKDSTVAGGIAVKVNCKTLPAMDWLGSIGRSAVREYVAAHSAIAAAADSAEVGEKFAAIVKQYAKDVEGRNAALAALADSVGAVDEQFVDHLHASLVATVKTATLLLAPLPAGV